MPDDDTLTHLLTRSAAAATRDVVAPDSWATTVPQRAARRRRHRTMATGAAATLTAAAIAGAIAIPLTRTDHAPGARLAAFTLTTSTSDSRAAARELSCLTATPPAPAGSTPVLGLGGAAADGTSCSLLQGRQDTSLPRDARAVSGRTGRLYLGASTSAYRLGYRTYAAKSGDPLVLQIAVAGTVSTSDLLTILDSVDLVSGGR